MESIFISMPSIRDTESAKTIKNAYETALNPDRVYFGVSVLDTDRDIYSEIFSLSMLNDRITTGFNLLDTSSIDQIGTGSGRVRSMKMYSGQDYYLQIDSHTNFEQGWDNMLISLFKDAKKETGLDRLVLTGYLGKYGYFPERKRMSGEDGDIRTVVFIPGEFFGQAIPRWDDFMPKNKTNAFIPCIKFSGNFAFSDKSFIENSGVVEEAIFFDEEILQSINLIGSDFAMVFPNIPNFPLTHLYSEQINEHGGDRSYFNDYLTEQQKTDVSIKGQMNYINYIKNPENSAKIAKYEKYARINIKRGAIIYNYIPKKFIVED